MAPGQTLTRDYFVTSDECHVIPVQATANLQPL
jgi:hypothetical protein